MNIMGMETNLKPFCESTAEAYMDVFHMSAGSLIPAFLVAWSKPKDTAGEYSVLPYIQYLNEDGEAYGVTGRPAWFKQYVSVRPKDLFVYEA